MFDLALARALSAAPVVAEYLIPLIRPEGEALIYKGKWSQSNEKELNNTLIVLKSKIQKVERLELPANQGVRHVIRLTLNSSCPKEYPRPIGIPEKKPLGQSKT